MFAEVSFPRAIPAPAPSFRAGGEGGWAQAEHLWDRRELGCIGEADLGGAGVAAQG